jgi:hypothetical protein
LIRSFQLLTLAGLLMQSFSAIASIPERLPKPPGSREVLFLFPLILNPKHINPRTFTAIFFQKKD